MHADGIKPPRVKPNVPGDFVAGNRGAHMDGLCGLCDLVSNIRESHIVPSFAYNWLKDSSVTGHMHHGEAVNKRVQDGEKRYRNMSMKMRHFYKIFSVPLHRSSAMVC